MTASVLLAQSPDPPQPAPAPEKVKKAAALRDPDDGWLDLSKMLEKPYGFFPAVMPITEPAVGYGLAVFPIFLRPRSDAGAQGYARPNMTTAGGLFTSNQTWGVLAGDSSIWKGGRIETLVAGGYFSINLKYYADGAEGNGSPFENYNLTTSGGIIRARFRLRDTHFFVGSRYMFLQVDATPGTTSGSIEPPPGLGRTDRIGGPSIFLTYDSRDNILTPTKGIFAETNYSYFDRAFGGTFNYQRIEQLAIFYAHLHPRLNFGVYADGAFTFGQPDFYARPYVTLRGVPAMRYQRENVAETELELRWQFWKRFSLVGFGGAAVAWNSTGPLNRSEVIGAGGAGVRYLLARKFGLHYGIDVARGPDDWAVYFQFGSAWTRP